MTKKQIRQTKAALSDELERLRQIMHRQQVELHLAITQSSRLGPEVERLRAEAKLNHEALREANLEAQKMDVERARMAQQRSHMEKHIEALQSAAEAGEQERSKLREELKEVEEQHVKAVEYGRELSATIVKLRIDADSSDALCAALRTQRDGWIKFFHQESTLWQRIMRCGPNLKYLK